MGLAEIIKNYLKRGDGGVISIKLHDEAHLLKLYIENEEVLYVTLGTLKGDECLSKLKNAIPVEHFFLKGVKAPQKVEGGCTEKLFEALGISKDLLKTEEEKAIPPENIEKLEKEFIELIGPIGKLIIDDLFSKLVYSRGNFISNNDYRFLIDALTKELPPSEKERFSSKYKI